MATGAKSPSPTSGRCPGYRANQGVNSAGSISNAQAGAALTKSERKKARGTARTPGPNAGAQGGGAPGSYGGLEGMSYTVDWLRPSSKPTPGKIHARAMPAMSDIGHQVLTPVKNVRDHYLQLRD
jgi:hypothetical protein